MKYIMKHGFVRLPDRRKLLTSQEEDHIKVLKGEMSDIEYEKRWVDSK